MSRLVVFVLAMTILTACGLKGPLYLPEKSGPVVIKPAAAESSASSAESASSSSSSSSSASSIN